MKLKKTVTLLTLGTSLFMAGAFKSNITNIKANTVKEDNEIKNNKNNNKKIQKQLFGNYLYKQYSKAMLNVNSGNPRYGSSHIYTEVQKLPLDFFAKQPKKMSILFSNTGNIAHNTVALKSDVDASPWEKDDSKENNLLQNLSASDVRTIYYHINATGKLASLYNAAIDGWNGLGVIKLVPTDSTDDEVIQLNTSQKSLDHGNADGITYTNYYTISHTFADVSISVTNDVVNKYDDYAALVVVEHEIGHALGFGHYNKKFYYGNGKHREFPLMAGTVDAAVDGDSDITDLHLNTLVGAKEQHKLMQMYNLSVMSGYYVYPEINSVNDKFY